MRLRYWGSIPAEDQEIIANILAKAKKADVDLDIESVDVLAEIDRAIAGQVFVTPTLDRLDPEPAMRLIAITDDAAGILKKLRS